MKRTLHFAQSLIIHKWKRKQMGHANILYWNDWNKIVGSHSEQWRQKKKEAINCQKKKFGGQQANKTNQNFIGHVAYDGESLETNAYKR